MASINKVKIGDATYDMSPSPTGTLDTTSTAKFTSNDVDQSSATSYVSVNKIDAAETNSSIFSKLTSMVRNARYLHNKVGTTDISDIGDNVTDAISKLNTKAPVAHSHTTTDLPVSNNQVNSSNYIPTSALIYSMNQNLALVNDYTMIGSDFITNVDCGGIKAGTSISSSDTLQSIVKDMIRIIPEPPTEYESISIGTWSSLEDVNNFFTTHTPQNGWAGLKLGNRVTINGRLFRGEWEIAGFNLEHNQLAADGTTYDNGYGICMIPKTKLSTATKWNKTDTLTGGYKASTMHNEIFPMLANDLKTILGDHLINRNVLLSSSVDDSDNSSNAYEWTTAYATLMSVGQLNGTFASHNNKYDDGEANYKLPLFDYENFGIGSAIELRGIAGKSSSGCYIWAMSANTDPLPYGIKVTTSIGARPLIYLR